MRCRVIFKRLISFYRDSGREFPELLLRHLTKCPECRAFQGFCDDLQRRAASDAEGLPRPDGWNSIPSLPDLSPSAFVPRTPFGKRRMRPAVAALTIATLAAAVLLLQQPFRSRMDRSVLESIPTPSAALRRIELRFESPLEVELRRIEDAINSASESLRTRITIPAFFQSDGTL